MDIVEQHKVLKVKGTSFYQDTFSVSSDGLSAFEPKVLQINVGKWCNQTCRHCHVDASPIRKEQMSVEVARQCLKIIKEWDCIETVDLTGGAPEGHEVFRELVEGARALGKHVIDRCNLTILTEDDFEWLPKFLKENQVEVVSSLPHFAAHRTDKQRGNGVFERSIKGLKLLNEVGYGIQDDLKLSLVYNPSGVLLSGSQAELEREFKEKLFSGFGIKFHQLFCINNLPINRFLESLLRVGKYESYLQTLKDAFNPATLEGLMCRHQLSVSWDGKLYDCDFNQMLEMQISPQASVFDVQLNEVSNRSILCADHCYGCTAGAGSSCGGEIA